ncbi:MAG TPA: collagen-like protein [Solirubrobacteraceae bacterium]
MRKRITYANVAATLALVLAMSGGALAANHYLIHSTKQISPKVLKALKGNVGPKGAAGTTGASGTPGKEGPAGKEGKQGVPGPVNVTKLEKVEGPFEEPEFVFIFDIASSHAECPAGSHAVSGGSEVSETQLTTLVISEATINEGKMTGWTVLALFKELKGGVRAVAYCAKEGNAVVASRPIQRRTSRAALKAEAVKLHRLHRG